MLEVLLDRLTTYFTLCSRRTEFGESVRKTLAIFLVLGFFLSGCTTQQASSPPSTSAEVTQTAEPQDPFSLLPFDEPPAWNLSSSPSPVEECRVPDMRPEEARHLWRNQVEGDLVGAASVGFPRREREVPAMGQANIIFAKVAFDDAPPSDKVSDSYIREQLMKVQSASEHWSQGKFRYEFQIVDGWVEVPVNHWDYQISQTKTGNADPHKITLSTQDLQFQVAQLVIDELPETLDFSSADLIAIYWSPNTKAFKTGITPSGRTFDTPDGEMRIAFYSPSVYATNDEGQPYENKMPNYWKFLGHEFLHSQGFDLHAPGNGWKTGIGQSTDTPKDSGILSAWDVFLSNWFEDSQVYCAKIDDISDTQFIELTPLEIYGGDRKIAIFRFAESKALVIESRRPIGLSSGWPERWHGLLAYEIDTVGEHRDHIQGDCGNSPEIPKWAYYLIPDDAVDKQTECMDPAPAFIKPGMKLEFRDITIHLDYSAENADYIRVEKASGD